MLTHSIDLFNISCSPNCEPFEHLLLNHGPQVHFAYPFHGPQAGLACPVEVTGHAILRGYNCGGLQAVGEDDIGVHRCHVQVIDEGHLLPEQKESREKNKIKKQVQVLSEGNLFPDRKASRERDNMKQASKLQGRHRGMWVLTCWVHLAAVAASLLSVL